MAAPSGPKMSSIPTKGSTTRSARISKIKPSLGQRDYGKQTSVGSNPMLASPITGGIGGEPMPSSKGGLNGA